MNITPLPNLSEIFGLLNEYDKDALADLGNRFPGKVDLGHELGSADEAADAFAANGQFYLASALEGLNVVRKRVEPNLDYLRSRLKNVRTLRLVAGLVTAVSSADLLANLASHGSASIATGAVNLIASVCTVFAEHLESLTKSGRGDLSDTFDSLVRLTVQADSLKEQLKIDTHMRNYAPPVQERVNQAVKVSAEIRELELRVGTAKKRRS